MSNRKSDLSRAFSEDGERKTHIGGQALIEGIMMRGRYNWAVVVRQPDGGMHVEEHDLKSGKSGNGWLSWPLVRGCRALVESLMLGFKALEIAAVYAFDDEDGQGDGASSGLAPSVQARSDEGESAREAGCSPEPSSSADREDKGSLGHAEMVVSMILGVLLGVVLFIVAPALITNLLVGEYDDKTLMWNVVDGIVRVVLFIAYIWVIGRMGEIRRMFSYHGAEHKVIHCYEHALPLTVENARCFPCLHVRCGTAFLIMVMLIAIFVYTVLPLNSLIMAWGIPDGAIKLVLVMLVRVLLMPVIAGISYEITVKWAGANPRSPLVRVVLWPGMQMQRLTTNEPDDDMIECAIVAMRAVLNREETEHHRAYV